MAVKPIPDGYHTVTPYLIVEGVPRLIEFLASTFDARETHRSLRPDGSVAHAEVRIGDSALMMGEAGEQWPAKPCALHLYLEDVDAAYRRALGAGAVSLMEPTDQFYGDRSAGVTDPSGNQWFLATHIEDVSPEEIQRRAKARTASAAH